MTLKEQLIRDEGLKLKPYTDTVGKLTIGVGRNLSDVGISEIEADNLLSNDILKAQVALNNAGYSGDKKDPRYAVLINMIFNLGPKFLTWTHTLGFYKDKDYESCAREILHSEPWASQVKARAIRLSEQMRTGIWQ